MVKWLNIFIVILFTGGISLAQQNQLLIEGSTPKLFISHKVAPKENFYSIGRLYNVPPKDLAAYNNLQFENGLNVGEAIKIPLTDNNFSQSDVATAGDALIPVYHNVLPKEGLYRVSLNYNKVPIASLKKWNHIQSDAVSAGSPVIVGYLRASGGGSSVAGKGVTGNAAVASVDRPVRTEPAKPDVVAENLPPVKNPDTKIPDTNKPEKKDVQETDEHKVTVTSVHTKSSINFSGGYFRKMYDSQVESKTPVSENASAGIFKSTSGWQDGKYYCFNNNAPPGTIIKITDNSTGKSVYAKVLDAVPDIKQNADLSLILSNSAAEELGIPAEKFDCTLSYIK